VRVPGLARYALARPTRVGVIARAAWRMRRDGWWRRAPFLPTPGDAYLKFRVTTAYGATAQPSPRDVVDAARWALAQRTGR
ncbi:MAG: hypothetical protein ACRDV0_03290, partial [Acidimicrobiales bacterium]